MAGMRVPRFFYDVAIRQALQGIYVGIAGSNDNAEILSTLENPLTISPEQIHGNEVVRYGFLSGIRWLSAISEFVRSDDIFEFQILTPFRLSAGYLLTIRRMSEPTTILRGLVYSVSKPFFSKFFEQQVIDLSLIIPELGTAMLYRCPAPIVPSNCLFKECEIPYAQPIPLMNRIHPSRFPSGLLSVGSREIVLDRYAFLNISLKDLKAASRSFAFENYCEAESAIYGKRRLGILCILSGRVKYIDEATIILRDILERDSCTLRLSPVCARSITKSEELRKEKLVEKPVKVLSIIWYHYSSGRPENPEALYIQKCDDDFEALLSDAVGYIRVRGRIEVESVRKIYNQRVVDLLSEDIVFDGQSLIWKHKPLSPITPIISEFIHTLDRLRETRANMKCMLTPLLYILDKKKLQANYYASIVCKKNLLSILFNLIRDGDKRGYLAESFEELKRRIKESSDRYYYSGELEEAVYFLKGMRLLKSVKNSQKRYIKLSQFSYDVAYAAVRSQVESILRDILRKRGWLSIFDLLEIQDYPLPLLSQGVKDLVNRGIIFPLHLQEFGTVIVWSVDRDWPNARVIREQLIPRISRITDSILDILSNITHPISTDRLAEELLSREIRVSKELLTALLQNLQRQGRIRRINNDMWFYPWERRIIDFLEKNQAQIFTEEEIIKAINPPYPIRVNFKRYLNGLENQGLIRKVGEYFCWRSFDIDTVRQQHESIVKKKAEEEALQILKECREIDEETFKAKLRVMITTLIHEEGYRGLNISKITDDVWQGLVGSGRIKLFGNRIVYKGDY